LAWLTLLTRDTSADLGLLACFGRAGLSESGYRVPLCAADALMMLLVRRAYLSGHDLALELPPGSTLSPLLLATKLLLGSMLEQMCATSLDAEGAEAFQFPTGRGILIVSPSVEMRSRYAATTVTEEALVYRFPGYRLRPDGSAVQITPSARYAEGDPAQPLCFFLARQRALPETVEQSPAMILLDFLHGRWGHRANEILTWAGALAVRQNPMARVVALLPLEDDACLLAVREAGMHPFPMDLDALEHARSGFATPDEAREVLMPPRSPVRDWSLSRWEGWDPERRTHQTLVIQGAEILVQQFEALNNLLGAYHHQESRDLRIIRWLTALLAGLNVPVPWYERATRGKTIWSLIEGIGAYGPSLSPELREVVAAARARLKACYELLRQENPKSDVLLETVRCRLPSLGSEERLGVLARDRTMAEALRVWLYSEGQEFRDPRLVIGCHADWDLCAILHEVVLTGPWPARYRWQLAGAIGHAITFIVYPGEEQIVGHQVRRFFGLGARWRRSSERGGAVARLAGASEPGGAALFAADEEPAEGRAKTVQEILAPGRASTWTPKHWVPRVVEAPAPPRGGAETQWVEDDAEEDLDPISASGADALALARATRGFAQHFPCVEIQVHEKLTGELWWMYLPEDQTSDVLMPDDAANHEGDDSGGLCAVANTDLEPGMTLIGTDDGKRRDLFDHLMELADATPELRPLKMFQEQWRTAMDECAARFQEPRSGRIEYGRLLAALQAEGAPITDHQAVRLWVAHKVLGPADIKSIRAVGLLAGHPILRDSSRQVHDALNDLRGVRSAMGRRLGAALRTAASFGPEEPAHAPPRSRGRTGSSRSVPSSLVLSIPLEELVDAMQFWQIECTDSTARPVPAALVGQLIPARWDGS
jgi:hypothetical protein